MVKQRKALLFMSVISLVKRTTFASAVPSRIEKTPIVDISLYLKVISMIFIFEYVNEKYLRQIDDDGEGTTWQIKS